MERIPFTVSARTARLIGRENVAHAEGAVIELVKNCYDADSDFSLVIVNPKNNTITILDNGSGMSKLDVLKHWMTIGTDNKEKLFKSSKGRIKAGAKGIGRFALDRLGQRCIMFTKQKNQKDGIKWSANWNDFEKPGATIEKVYAEVEEVKNINLIDQLKTFTSLPKVFNILKKYNTYHGTLIRIEVARDEWDEDISKKIYKSLEILTPPDGQAKFDIYFLNESHISQFGKIENETFSDYDYKLVAEYKKNKNKELSIKVYRNEFDFNLIDPAVFQRPDMQQFPFDKRTFKKGTFSIDSSFYQLIPGFRQNEKLKISDSIGDFTFTFYFLKNEYFERDAEIYKYNTFSSAIREKWLDKFAGIKLYRDHFRVRPYGEVGTASYDWLRLGERHAKSPAGISRKGDLRVRPNQVAGTIFFSRTSTAFLEDKSSREGLVENETFELFKNIITGIVRIFEDDRSTIGENLKEFYDEQNQDENAESEAVSIAENSDDNDDSETTKLKNRTLKRGIRSQKKKLEQRDQELVLSRAMASAGILIASFSHEFGHIRNKLNNRTNNLKSAVLGLLPSSKFKNLENRKNPLYIIDEIRKLDEKIKQWIEFSITLTRKDRRRSKKFSVVSYFAEFKKSWHKRLTERGIALNLSKPSDNSELFVKMIELDVDTIFDNLLANSIEAFQRDNFKGHRIIDISLSHDDNFVEIEYKDSGPGLSLDIKNPEEIFKAGFTTKTDRMGNEVGTGLGMWLLKSSVDYNKGRVKLYYPEKGFQIKIKLPQYNGRS